MVDVVELRSADHEETQFANRKLYCEDERLSIGPAGSGFLALVVEYNELPMMTPDLLQQWIDFWATFVDLEGYTPAGPAERKAVEDLKVRVANLDLVTRMSKQ